MEEKINKIKDLDLEERKEVFVDFARALENAATPSWKAIGALQRCCQHG